VPENFILPAVAFVLGHELFDLGLGELKRGFGELEVILGELTSRLGELEFGGDQSTGLLDLGSHRLGFVEPLARRRQFPPRGRIVESERVSFALEVQTQDLAGQPGTSTRLDRDIARAGPTEALERRFEVTATGIDREELGDFQDLAIEFELPFVLSSPALRSIPADRSTP